MRRKNTTTEMMKGYIMESLFILMKTKSFEDITIGEIADKAGVNRATYYRHFQSKEHIIKSYYSHIVTEYVGSISPDKKLSLEPYLTGMFKALLNYRQELLSLYKNNLSYLILDSLAELFLEGTEALSFDDEFKKYYHMGGIYGIFLLWFSHDMKESPAQMSKASVSTLSEGFSPMLQRK